MKLPYEMQQLYKHLLKSYKVEKLNQKLIIYYTTGYGRFKQKSFKVKYNLNPIKLIADYIAIQ